MIRKVVICLVVFLVMGVGIFAAGTAIDSAVRLPKPIESTSACPTVGCVSGSCHGFDNVPKPDGAHEMTCPEASCSALECHAWDTLASRYYQPNDMSLNLWILAPVALIIGLVVLVRKL